MPFYGDGVPYYYGNSFANHSSLMTNIGRPFYIPLSRYSPHLSTISESPLNNLRRYSPVTVTRQPRRTINTAENDVITPARTLSHEDSRQRHHLRRDRPTIKIRSQALKDNPALREHYEKRRNNVSGMLVEKFLIKDKNNYDQNRKYNSYCQSTLNRDESTEALTEAIQRRVTRRFTRRRSSTDVQLNPEQLERELAYAQVQAEVLDSLVAEEQAEMEIEARKACAKKKTHLSTKNYPQEEIIQIIDSNLEYEEKEKDEEERREQSKIRKKVKKKKKMHADMPSSISHSSKVTFDSLSENSDKDEQDQVSEENNWPKMTQTFKIEACNSVGDFSTHWFKNSPSKLDTNTDEQFRESIRLPAPKKLPVNNLEMEVQASLSISIPNHPEDNLRNSVHIMTKVPDKNEKVIEERRRRRRRQRLNQSELPVNTDETTIDIETKVTSIQSKDTTESSLEVKSSSDTLAISLASKSHSKNVRKSLNTRVNVIEERNKNLIGHNSEQEDNSDLLLKSDSNNINHQARRAQFFHDDVSPSHVIKTVNSEDDDSSRLEERTACNRERSEDIHERISRETLINEEESFEKNESPITRKSVNADIDSLSLNNQETFDRKESLLPKLSTYIRENSPKIILERGEEENIVSSTAKGSELDHLSEDRGSSKGNTPRLKSPIRTKLASKDSSSKSHPDWVSSPLNQVATNEIKSSDLSTKTRSASRREKVVSSNEHLSIQRELSEPSASSSPLNKRDHCEESSRLSIKSESITKSVPTKSSIDHQQSDFHPTTPSTIITDQLKLPTLLFEGKYCQVEKKNSPKTRRLKYKNSRDISPKTFVQTELTTLSEKSDAEDCDTPQNNSDIDFWSEINNSEERMDRIDNDSFKVETQEVIRSATIIKRIEIPEKEAENESEKSEIIMRNEKLLKSLEPLDLRRVRQMSNSFDSGQNSPSISEISTPISDSSFSAFSCSQNTNLADTSIQDDDGGLITPTNDPIIKLNKWNNLNNLANLDNFENDMALSTSSKKIISNSSINESTDSKKKKKKKMIVRRKKSSNKSEKSDTDSLKAPSKISLKSKSPLQSIKNNSNIRSSPRDNTPCRPADLMRIFYTTPRQLMTATPRDLQKVKRVKMKKRKPPSNASIGSDSTGSTGSTGTQSITTSTEDGCNSMDEIEQKRMASTRSNDSGFDGSPRLSNC